MINQWRHDSEIYHEKHKEMQGGKLNKPYFDIRYYFLMWNMGS